MGGRRWIGYSLSLVRRGDWLDWTLFMFGAAGPFLWVYLYLILVNVTVWLYIRLSGSA